MENILTVSDYQKLASRTINTNLSEKDILINSVMGLCGEAGEAIDIVKKHIAQGHDFNKEHFIEEIGDIAWYLAEAATAVDYDLGDILQQNIDKLRKRYPEGFKEHDSINRVN